MATKKFKFSEETKKAILNSAINQMRQKSQKIQEEIETFYLAEVDAFYEEYSPSVYVRHSYSDIYDSGLGRTCVPVLEESYKNGVYEFRSGIRVNTERMHDDYLGTPEQVLNSFMFGYHGLPPYKNKYGRIQYPPMMSDLRPVDDTWYFVDSVLLKNFDFDIVL